MSDKKDELLTALAEMLNSFGTVYSIHAEMKRLDVLGATPDAWLKARRIINAFGYPTTEETKADIAEALGIK